MEFLPLRATAEKVESQRRSNPRGYRRWSLGSLLPALLLLLLFTYCLIDLKISPQLFIEGIPHFFNLVSEMLPPNWEVFWRGKILWSILETLSMAFVGTFWGALGAFFLGLLGAANVSPSPIVREVAKRLLALERTIPPLIYILLLVVVIGLGPFAGMLVIALGTIGMLGKLFAEAIEVIDPKPLESIESGGATRLQVIRYAVLPQVLPSLIANTLYRFDINLRVALFLGVVGGGGIGVDLQMAMSLFRYADALAITLVTLLLIWMAERISDYLRRRVIGQEVLQ
ncbi:MAG: phosphonate ABC transporter, permease protein PhnE [Desulfobacterota bacterium]|nr:phosphonate ABC transporter, permease protein PhnE [Thermodesulfobacteriota bacterium]